ncbi:MAG: phosphoribosyl-ATP diphosphatase [Paludibacteraceae bacterium]|jgi:phosphoribosyl-ATP pyrophosphohydrolase/phosphoribosyl-AMP cyclohydrolase|nr:phosphoribosyl-ATP diphosphatase [Paludibacteraceae bacterium]MBO5988699.1 phosphoribosyl-ATP diphosphatase [Paludibacteraceae bacterium]MBQ1969630.1 phosphoribosyl-ATP diphosphatase [Paludibacteraceae bacterium]MEE1542528.1 phosphoribosyl-ATP diphosphatase [Paludibacteraceae bacterium]
MDANSLNLAGLKLATVQDKRTKKVLRMGFVDDVAMERMDKDGQVFLFDAEKGEPYVVVGGEYDKPLRLDSLIFSEDGKSVLIMAEPEGSTTGADTFLGDKNIEDLAFLSELQDFIEKRYKELPEGSYTTKLFKKGVNKMCQKVGEEMIEAIVEATNGSKDQFIYECSDMIYHLIVLLTYKGIRIEDLARELKARH